MSESKHFNKKNFCEYYCKRCFENNQNQQDQEQLLFIESMLLVVRHAIISKIRFLMLISPDEYFVPADIINLSKGSPRFFESKTQPFSFCSYVPLHCNICKDELGFVLKATPKNYEQFREKVFLFTEKIQIIDEEAQQQYLITQKGQQLTPEQKNQRNDGSNAIEQLKSNMTQLNNQLSQYQYLIERQGHVEQGLVNVTNLIAKLSKRITKI